MRRFLVLGSVMMKEQGRGGRRIPGGRRRGKHLLRNSRVLTDEAEFDTTCTGDVMVWEQAFVRGVEICTGRKRRLSPSLESTSVLQSPSNTRSRNVNVLLRNYFM
jgi:hypothetical protein